MKLWQFLPPALVALAACGGSGAEIGPGTPTDAGTDEDSAVGTPRDGGGDAPNEATVDGGVDAAIVCGNDTSKISNDCFAVKACSGVECAGAYRYVCRYADGDTSGRPAIDGCKPADEVSTIPFTSAWCCPAACVRTKELACDGGVAFACAPDAVPPSGCSKVAVVGVGSGYCCP